MFGFTYIQLTYELIFFLEYLRCRERVPAPKNDTSSQNNDCEKRTVSTALQSSPGQSEGSENSIVGTQNGSNQANNSARSLLKSASISASKCVEVKNRNTEVLFLFFSCCSPFGYCRESDVFFLLLYNSNILFSVAF